MRAFVIKGLGTLGCYLCQKAIMMSGRGGINFEVADSYDSFMYDNHGSTPVSVFGVIAIAVFCSFAVIGMIGVTTSLYSPEPSVWRAEQ